MASDMTALSRAADLTGVARGLLAADLGAVKLACLEEVPLQVEVRLGHARLTLGELLKLRAGLVLTLDRLVDEPAEVLVGGKVIARGQIVVVGDELGVRVTELAAAAGSGT
jgi:flagellar motor switch protein FliN/FliY